MAKTKMRNAMAGKTSQYKINFLHEFSPLKIGPTNSCAKFNVTKQIDMKFFIKASSICSETIVWKILQTG